MQNERPDKSRRRFLNWILGSSGAALLASALYPVLRFLSPPEIPEASTNEVDAGLINDPEFLEKGYKIVRFGADPVIVVKVAEGDFRAFSATCTHLDCIVEYRKDKELLWCNCHNGQFDLQGRNVAGPPPHPLESFTTHVVASGSTSTVIVERA